MLMNGVYGYTPWGNNDRLLGVARLVEEEEEEEEEEESE